MFGQLSCVSTFEEIDGDLDGLDTPKRLLRIADNMIAATGSDDIGVGDVARAAGVGRSTAYRHFGDRSALITDVARLRAYRMGVRCTLQTKQKITSTEKLETILVSLACAVIEDPLLRAAAQERADIQLSDNEIRNFMESGLTGILRAGQARGEFRNDTSADEMAAWLCDELLVMVSWREGVGQSPVSAAESSRALVVRRVQKFLIPALAPIDVHTLPDNSLGRVRAAVDELQNLVAALHPGAPSD